MKVLLSMELTLERCFPPSRLGCELALLTVSIYFFAMAYDYMVFEEQGFVWRLNVQSHATKIYKQFEYFSVFFSCSFWFFVLSVFLL